MQIVFSALALLFRSPALPGLAVTGASDSETLGEAEFTLGTEAGAMIVPLAEGQIPPGSGPAAKAKSDPVMSVTGGDGMDVADTFSQSAPDILMGGMAANLPQPAFPSGAADTPSRNDRNGFHALAFQVRAGPAARTMPVVPRASSPSNDALEEVPEASDDRGDPDAITDATVTPFPHPIPTSNASSAPSQRLAAGSASSMPAASRSMAPMMEEHFLANAAGESGGAVAPLPPARANDVALALSAMTAPASHSTLIASPLQHDFPAPMGGVFPGMELAGLGDWPSVVTDRAEVRPRVGALSLTSSAATTQATGDDAPRPGPVKLQIPPRAEAFHRSGLPAAYPANGSPISWDVREDVPMAAPITPMAAPITLYKTAPDAHRPMVPLVMGLVAPAHAHRASWGEIGVGEQERWTGTFSSGSAVSIGHLPQVDGAPVTRGAFPIPEASFGATPNLQKPVAMRTVLPAEGGNSVQQFGQVLEFGGRDEQLGDDPDIGGKAHHKPVQGVRHMDGLVPVNAAHKLQDTAHMAVAPQPFVVRDLPMGFSDRDEGGMVLPLGSAAHQQVPAAPSQQPAGMAGPLAQIAHILHPAIEGRTELRLAPEELGTVRIELRTEGERVTLVLSAERSETQELLRRNADRLAQELRTSGFTHVDMGFQSWTGQGDSPRSQPDEHECAAAITEHAAVLSNQPTGTGGSSRLSDGLYRRI